MTFLVSHELGHVLSARLTGDQDAYFRLTERRADGGRCIGCDHYSESKLSGLGRRLTPLAGPLLTRTLAVGADAYLARHPRQTLLSRGIAALSFAGHLDLPSYIIRDALFANNSGDRYYRQDVADFVTSVAGRGRGARSTAYLGLALLSGIDVYLSRRQIRSSWRRLFGESTEASMP